MLLIKEDHDTIHASFEGIQRFTCSFADDVEKELIPFVEDAQRELILNLEGITFIDSAAFDSILSIHKKAKESHSRFEVTNLCTDVKELFSLLKLDEVLLISEN